MNAKPALSCLTIFCCLGTGAQADLGIEELRAELAKGMSGDAIAKCLETGDDPQSCAHGQTDACISNADPNLGGEDLISQICQDLEYSWWDTRLNEVYAQLQEKLKQEDKARGTLAGESAQSLSDGLRDMQRSWIPFRDAECDYARRTVGGDGYAASIANGSCLIDATLQQMLSLNQDLQFYSQK